MTPLIDVVFLLLIFFVCASVGQEAESLLPTPLAEGSIASTEVTDTEPPVTAKVWVYLSRPDPAAGVVMKVEQRACSNFDELAANLKVLGDVTPESPVILDIGPNVPLETLVDTWDVCNQAGFHSINFATKAPPGA